MGETDAEKERSLTPSRTNGDSGSFIIERRFKNVGELKKSTGTESLREYNRRVALIEKLHATGRYELLRQWKKDETTIEALVEMDRMERLGQGVSDVQLRALLWPAVDKVFAKLKENKTNARYLVSLLALQRKSGLSETATISDLALVDWQTLADKWDASNADWMHMKRAVSRILGLAFKDKYHPFLRALRVQIPNKKPRKRRTRVSLSDFETIVSKAPAHAARSYWCLLITGLRDRTEYLALRREHLDHRTCSIDHPGEKTEEAAEPIKVSPRLWSRVVEAVPSRLKYAWLLKHWHRACVAAGFATYVPSKRHKSGLRYQGPTLHDIRRLHGQFAIDAGVAESKVQSSYRHSNPGQTRDYISYNATGEVSEALAHLILDGKKRKRA